MVNAIAAYFAPTSDQQKSQFFLPTATGLISLSIALLDNGISGCSRNCFSSASRFLA